MLLEVTTSHFSVYIGCLILLLAHFWACKQFNKLTTVLLFSSIAEIGAVLTGLGTGTIAGNAGAVLHLFYQVSIRSLAVFALAGIAGQCGSTNLTKLRGAFKRSPWFAGMFGFAMFSAIGFTPFKGAVSKLALTYGLVSAEMYLPTVLMLISNCIALWYTIKIVQTLCFEAPEQPQETAHSYRFLGFLTLVLGVVVAASHAFPETLIHAVVAAFGSTAAIPQFEAHWPLAATLPYVGAFLLFVPSKFIPEILKRYDWRFVIAAALSAVALVLTATADVPALSKLFACIMAGIGLLVTVYSAGYIHKENATRYWFFLLLMQGSLIGLTLTQHLGALYGFWELMTFSSYFLVIHEETKAAFSAGFKYFMMCAAGAYALLFGIFLIHSATGSFEFAAIAQATGSISPALAGMAALLCFIGFAVKAGLVPFHSWLPAAHPVAPSSISGPLSGILTKTGIYGMLMVCFALFGAGYFSQEGAFDTTTLITVLGALTLIVAETMALLQKNVKRMLAYSTMAQVGEIAAVLGLGTYLSLTGSMAHVVNHAIMKNLLFLGVGMLILRSGTYTISQLKGMGRAMPLTGLCLFAGFMGIMGLPPFGGFVSKFLMVYAALDAEQPLLAMMILAGGLMGVFYYTRLVRVLFFEKYEGEPVAEAPLTALLPMGILAGACLLLGIFPQLNLAIVAPVMQSLTAAGKIAVQPLPSLAIGWPLYAAIPMVGAVVPYIQRKNLEKSAWGTVAVLILAFIGLGFSWSSLDTLSICYSILIICMGILNTIYSANYMDHSHTQWRFFTLFLLMIGGLLGVATSSNLFVFFFFWEIMSSWPLYSIIIHEESPSALREGFKYFAFNILGASLMFFGVALLTSTSGVFGFGELAQALGTMSSTAAMLGVACIAIGFAMKAAMLPLRIDIWMHPATAPTPVSGYISSVLLKTGPFGLMKLFFVIGGAGFFAGKSGIWGQPAIMYALAWVAGITIFYAALKAIMQTSIKRVLIYSTVSQMAYVLLGICIGTSLSVSGGLMHFVNHMFFKNLLFLAAGAVMYRTHADTLDELSGIGRKMPFTLTVFAIAAFSAVGVPPLSGFTSKWMLYQALMAEGEILLALLALSGSVLTLAYMIKFLHAAFFGPVDPKLENVTEVGKLMRMPMATLAGASLFFGVFPGLLLAPINSILESTGFTPLAINLGGITTGAGAWDAVSCAFVMALSYGVARLILSFMTKKERVCHTHGCGVTDIPAEKSRVSGSNFYEPALTVLEQWLSLPAEFFAGKRKK
ncbi:MAG: oxidoreductase [Desulfovibrionales bacterium]|nr:oxidoreductase [Desulfovibrionales bacterium]